MEELSEAWRKKRECEVLLEPEPTFRESGLALVDDDGGGLVRVDWRIDLALTLYSIDSAWPGAVETPDAVGAKFLRMLDSLTRASGCFSDWMSSDEYAGDKQYLIESLHSDIGSWVRAHVALDDDGRPQPSDGYWLVGVSGGVVVSPKPPEGTSKKASFYVKAGSAFRNYAHFEIGSDFQAPDPAVVTYSLYRAALVSMISLWPAPWANAQCAIWGERPPTLPGEPAFPYSGYQMPWISYLCAERAAKVDVAPAIKTERTADGGLLMTATEARFDPANVEHMRASRLMAQIMMRYGGNPDA